MIFGSTAKGHPAAPTGKPGEDDRGQFAKARDAVRERRHRELVHEVGTIADGVRAGLAPSLNAIPLTASEPRVVRTSKGLQRLATSNTRLIGWSLANTGAVAAHVRFITGRDEGGDIVAVIDIPAGSSSTMRIGTTGGVSVTADGLTLQVTPAAAGEQLEGSVHLGAVD